MRLPEFLVLLNYSWYCAHRWHVFVAIFHEAISCYSSEKECMGHSQLLVKRFPCNSKYGCKLALCPISLVKGQFCQDQELYFIVTGAKYQLLAVYIRCDFLWHWEGPFGPKTSFWFPEIEQEPGAIDEFLGANSSWTRAYFGPCLVGIIMLPRLVLVSLFQVTIERARTCENYKISPGRSYWKTSIYTCRFLKVCP